ncbi:fungal-specific transcription factor domain-containing protein [Cryomyces antarcticus]
MATPYLHSIDSLNATTFDAFDVNLLSPLSIPPEITNVEKQFDWSIDDCSIGSTNGNDDAPTPTATKDKRKPSQPSNSKSTLACLICRPKKIRCQRENDTCRRCVKLKLQCVVPDGDERRRPSSKTHIRELEQRIRSLETALQEQKDLTAKLAALTQQDVSAFQTEQPASLPNEEKAQQQPSTPIDPALSEKPRSLIARLCARQSSLSADEAGQLRFFGPTSSLHTAESTSSFFVEYYSKALLYAIFACAARISELPYVRELSFAKEPGSSGKEPYLLKKAMILVEEELEQGPGITTIQALQLLSVCHCARASDTKGWMDTGRAIRLIFELGLHRNPEDIESLNLSKMDLEVRKTVFWGCFTFDRVWSLYLGRPYAIKLEDVTVRKPLDGNDSPSWEVLILAAWIDLLDIVGHICNELNHDTPTSRTFIMSMNQRLLDWRDQLDPSLQHKLGAASSVCNLHMQFCSAMILLHRPSVRFGTPIENASPSSLESRSVCVEYAVLLTTYISDFRQFHGSARTMLGTALYNITMAAIVLIADMADRTSLLDADYSVSIDICIQALREIEDSYIVARTILKQLKYLMKRCQLLDVYKNTETIRNMGCSLLPSVGVGLMDMDSPPQNLNGQMLQPEGPDAMGADFLIAMEQCDALHSIGTWS